MMFRALYDEIKKIFVANITDTDLPLFVESTLDEKVTLVKELIEANPSPFLYGAGEPEAKCYVLILHLAMKLVPMNSPELYALKEQLKIPVITQWPKANPPTTEFAMFSEYHVPPWGEEVVALSTAGRLLSFESLKDYQDVVVAAKTALGIGGMEDLGDSRTIQRTDVTLEIAARYVLYTLITMRPDWHSEGVLLKELPEGVDPRPKYVLDAEADAVVQTGKMEARKKAALEKKDQARKEVDARKKALFDLLSAADISVWKFVNWCVEKGLEGFKAFSDPVEGKPTWIPDNIIGLVPLADLPEDKEAAKLLVEEKLQQVEQFVLSKVAEKKPDWIRTFRNGTLGVRVRKLDKRLTRAELATRRALNKLFEKYGALELAKAVMVVYGLEQRMEAVFGPTLPQTSMALLTAAESEEAASEEPVAEEAKPEEKAA